MLSAGGEHRGAENCYMIAVVRALTCLFVSVACCLCMLLTQTTRNNVVSNSNENDDNDDNSYWRKTKVVLVKVVSWFIDYFLCTDKYVCNEIDGMCI